MNLRLRQVTLAYRRSKFNSDDDYVSDENYNSKVPQKKLCYQLKFILS